MCLNTDMKERSDFYQHDEVLFEIVKILKGREAVFFGLNADNERNTFRCIKAHHVDVLRQNFRAFGFDTKPLNIYYSLAQLYNMPVFSFNLKQRKIEQEKFNEEFDKYMTGFDFGMDFDADSKMRPELYAANQKAFTMAEILEDVKKVKREFDAFKVPYQVKASGRGFHINIASQYFDALKVKDRFALMCYMTDRMIPIFGLKSLCGSTKFLRARMIWKCPYSFDYKSNNIALPLDDEQIENFTPEILRPKNVIDAGVRNRGLLERNAGNSQGLKDFIMEYIVGADDL